MDEQAGLLRRILASRHFEHAEMLKRILRYVSRGDADRAPPSEYEIAINAIGRPNSFDPKLDPIVRVSMTAVRQRLDSYFRAEGRKEPLKLTVPKGSYRALYTPNVAPKETEGKADGEPRLTPSVERFWRPHFEAGPANILVHSEPLFLRDDHGTRIRHVRVNDPDTAVREIRRLLPGLEGSFVPYYAYLTVGTVHCMLAVFRTFNDAGVSLELKSARSCAWHDLLSSSLILIGNVGANSYLDALQGGGNFVLAEDFIRNMEPQPGEQAQYCGKRYMDGKLARHNEYAVVTRKPGLAPGTVITMIGAPHGKAHEASGQFLTSEEKLAGVLEHLQPGPGKSLPDYFQLLLEVDMIDIADEVIGVKSVANRFCAPP
jgi:hypothetical protein